MTGPDLISRGLAVQARAATFPRLPGDPGAGFGHPVSGTRAGLERLSAASLRAHWARFGQRGSVLGVVADADAQEIYDLVANLFADAELALRGRLGGIGASGHVTSFSLALWKSMDAPADHAGRACGLAQQFDHLQARLGLLR